MSSKFERSNFQVAIVKSNLNPHLTNPGMGIARQQAGGDSSVIRLGESAAPEVLARG